MKNYEFTVVADLQDQSTESVFDIEFQVFAKDAFEAFRSALKHLDAFRAHEKELQSIRITKKEGLPRR